MRMEEPIVSIYDMLMKRYRQQRRDELQQQQQQKEPLPNRQGSAQLEPQAAAQPNSDKKPRPRMSRPRVVMDSLAGCKMATNVVTATHLTKKQSGVLLQPPLKKEVLNQLVAKMSGANRKQMAAAAAPTAATASDKPSTSLNKKRSKTGKALKSSHGSESSNARARLVLSPRNTNRQLKPQNKRDKSKINNELKQQQQQQESLSQQQQRRPKNAEFERQKIRLRTRLSKISVTAKDQSADNAVRCRL